jgi:hypothetical protein
MSGFASAARQARGWPRAVASMLAAVVVMVGCAQTAAAGAESEKSAGAVAVRIHADADWYRARPERERRWRGTLRERPVVAGPASRTALSYALETSEGSYPVYAAGVETALARLAGQLLDVEGKLVDLADEGFGKELWIATVRPLGKVER